MKKSPVLEPFDPEMKCPKCGHDVVSIDYREATPTEKLPERIHRTCLRCSFEFDQACLSNGNGHGVHARAQTKKTSRKKSAPQPA